MHIKGNFEKPHEKPVELDGTSEMSKPIEAKDNLKLVQDRKNESTFKQQGVFCITQMPINPIAVVVHKFIVEVFNKASLTPSPTSVVHEQLVSNQKLKTDAPQSNS